MTDEKSKASDDELEIEIEEEGVEETVSASDAVDVLAEDSQEEEPDDKELASYSERVQKRIKQLTKRAHDAERQRQEAEGLAGQAINDLRTVFTENQKLRSTLTEGEKVLLQQSEKGLGAMLAEARREFKDALDTGDTEKQALAQEKMTQITVELARVKHFKGLPEGTPKAPPQVQVNQRPQVVVDPKAKEWVEKNQWFNTDEEMKSFALAFSRGLEQKGVDPRSDGYYRQINAEMRKRFPDRLGVKTVTQRPANVVAPVTRTTIGPRKVTLTQRQIELAKRLNVPVEEYAKEALAIQDQEK